MPKHEHPLAGAEEIQSISGKRNGRRCFRTKYGCMLLTCSPFAAPPHKKARTSGFSSKLPVVASRREDADSDGRSNDDKREEDDNRQGVSGARSTKTPAAVVAQQKPTKGIILRSGRIRLPDKLIQVRTMCFLYFLIDSLVWRKDLLNRLHLQCST